MRWVPTVSRSVDSAGELQVAVGHPLIDEYFAVPDRSSEDRTPAWTAPGRSWRRVPRPWGTGLRATEVSPRARAYA